MFQETTTSLNDLGTSMLWGSVTGTPHFPGDPGVAGVHPKPAATAEASDIKLTK